MRSEMLRDLRSVLRLFGGFNTVATIGTKRMLDFRTSSGIRVRGATHAMVDGFGFNIFHINEASARVRRLFSDEGKN